MNSAADRNKVGLVINSKTLVVTAIDAFTVTLTIVKRYSRF
jgi:hypothetical protein